MRRNGEPHALALRGNFPHGFYSGSQVSRKGWERHITPKGGPCWRNAPKVRPFRIILRRPKGVEPNIGNEITNSWAILSVFYVDPARFDRYISMCSYSSARL